MKLIMKFLFLSIMILFPACSKESDSSWTDTERQDAMDSCVTSGNESAFCECSVEILTSLFTYEEFDEFDKVIGSGAQPHPEIASKMIKMSKQIYSTCK